MSRLFAAELRRVAVRRMVRIFAVIALIGIVAGGLIAFLNTSALSESAYRDRVRRATVERSTMQQRAEECLRANGVDPNARVIPDELARKCIPDDVRAHDPRLRRDRLEGTLKGVSGVLAIIGWAMGASLIGAEFASRSLTTLLTWESRRTRVFVAKMAAVFVAGALFAFVVLVLVSLSFIPALVFHGAPARPSDPSVGSLAATVGRGVALTAIASGIGFAIATIGRNTAAALGAGFAYVIVIENILGGAVVRWRRWLLLGNFIVFVSGSNHGGEVPGRTVTTAGLYLSAVVVTFLVVALLTFRSRDVA